MLPKLHPPSKMENVNKGAIPKKKATIKERSPTAKRKKDRVEESKTGLNKQQLLKLAQLISKDIEKEKKLTHQFTIKRDTLQTICYIQQNRIENLASACRHRSNIAGNLSLLQAEKKKAEASHLYQIYRDVQLESEMHKIYECEVDKLMIDRELAESFIMKDLEQPSTFLKEMNTALEMEMQMSETMTSRSVMKVKRQFQYKIEQMLMKHALRLRKIFKETPKIYQQKIKDLEEKYDKIIKNAIEKHEEERNEMIKNYSEVIYDNFVLIDKIKAAMLRLTGESQFRRIQEACKRTEENIARLTKELETTTEQMKTVEKILKSRKWSVLNRSMINNNYSTTVKSMEDMKLRKNMLEIFSQQGGEEVGLAQDDLIRKTLEYQERKNLDRAITLEKIRLLKQQIREKEAQIYQFLSQSKKPNTMVALWNKVKLSQKIMRQQDIRIKFLEESIERMQEVFEEQKRNAAPYITKESEHLLHVEI